MGYDLQVWSVEEPNTRQIARDLDGWHPSGQSITFQTAVWQIVVGPSSAVEDEDIPEEILRALPGIRFLTEVNLEPIHAPEAAHDKALSMAARIAKSYHGVFIDPQEGTITLPRGVKRIERPGPAARISVVDLAWWFNESPLLEKDGLARFVSALEQQLPEALPRRYGTREPPQYRYDTLSKPHLVQLLASETLGVVWYPDYPFLNVWLGIYGGNGPTRLGYKTNDLHFQIDASAWTQPGWDLALRRFWYDMSDFIRPFFGEVRVLRNYSQRGGRLLADGTTETHPIRNGWWNGVPKQLGTAVVIDRRYAELWPSFVKKSHQRNDLHYVTSDDWISGKRVDQLIGGVPTAIAQGRYSQPPPRIGRTTYPRKWPFEHPFAEE